MWAQIQKMLLESCDQFKSHEVFFGPFSKKIIHDLVLVMFVNIAASMGVVATGPSRVSEGKVHGCAFQRRKDARSRHQRLFVENVGKTERNRSK